MTILHPRVFYMTSRNGETSIAFDVWVRGIFGTSPSGDVQFCSATYRLFKVNPSEQSREKDTVMEVQYKGEGDR